MTVRVGGTPGVRDLIAGILDDRVVPEDMWERWPEPDEPIVFVVGAGFSRAVSDRMPLTDQLGEIALERSGCVRSCRPGWLLSGFLKA
jgi:hypothetical protein